MEFSYLKSAIEHQCSQMHYTNFMKVGSTERFIFMIN